MHPGLSQLVDSNLSAEEFVVALQGFAARSRAVNHPLLQAFAQREFTRPEAALKDFFGQYFFYSYRFTQYLTSVISRLDSPQHRAQLAGNLAEETGHLDPEHAALLRGAGINPADASFPHPLLFRRFLEAIGLDVTQLMGREPDVATAAWVETFQEVCRSPDAAQGVGALGIATEAIVRFMYASLLTAIQQTWPQMSLRDRVFFDLHAAVDDEHAEVLRGIAMNLAQTPRGRMSLAMGTLRALDARANFFDHMMDRLRRLDAAAQG
ncbi:TenA family transcriptional regulator [Stigmatella erecta]|uniref:Pyrroloquinoline quinone (PQQ) biosynthesis protein C n=1 Tax=Stigmatella erecta TaxID=83460 RepID=A0A1I0KW41_9BACT|nr:iron-containing redox enzyme family protein [Stigmatella erecta]SEU30372.1 Pyrroloquinoline quinone (PQQ) biosynthesis protein C [Stigmatella erecta]